MINLKDKNVTVGSVTAQLPEAADIFKKYGIDYCCGGNRKLSDVIKEQKLHEKEIHSKLEEALKERKEGYEKGQDFTAMEPKNSFKLYRRYPP